MSKGGGIWPRLSENYWVVDIVQGSLHNAARMHVLDKRLLFQCYTPAKT